MKLLVTALEPSSNKHLKALMPHLPDVELLGVFDPELGSPLCSPQEFSIMGFVDAVKKIKFFMEINSQLAKLALQADKVLLMDSSSFNTPLAKNIKKIEPKKEVIYYILPQVWAWKPWRVKKIERYCDQLASILPFEQSYYTKANYVGHPLLDEIQDYKTCPMNSGKVAFMPGSRKSEISNLMPIFLELRKKIDAEALLVVPDFITDERLKGIYGDVSGFRVVRDAHEALYEAEYAFICSGTATLEAAIIGTPFTLAYRAKNIDYIIAKSFVKLQHIGLANIFFEKMGEAAMHDEILQDDLSVENLFNSYHKTKREDFCEKSKILRDYLGHGSAQNVARMILEEH